MRVMSSSRFWVPFVLTAIVFSAFFAWELGFFAETLPSLLRVPPTTSEQIFTVLLILFLALDAGLLAWQKKYGTCPLGVRRATGVGGAVGAFALLCPVCLILPLTISGASISLLFMAPFIPLLRIIALLLLIVSTMLLWPRKKHHRYSSPPEGRGRVRGTPSTEKKGTKNSTSSGARRSR